MNAVNVQLKIVKMLSFVLYIPNICSIHILNIYNMCIYILLQKIKQE